MWKTGGRQRCARRDGPPRGPLEFQSVGWIGRALPSDAVSEVHIEARADVQSCTTEGRGSASRIRWY